MHYALVCPFLVKTSDIDLQFYWKRVLSQVFSCKFYGLFQNIFRMKHLWVSASATISKNGGLYEIVFLQMQ